MDPRLQHIGTVSATLFYPALTEDELGDPDQLILGYRRALGWNRVLFAALGAACLVGLAQHVIRGPRAAGR